MSISQVHLLTAGLGMLACLLLLGICRSRPVLRDSRWSLGLTAALILAASPLIRFWYTFADTAALLEMSLLISCIGLSALLLVAVLFHNRPELIPVDTDSAEHDAPVRAARNRRAKAAQDPALPLVSALPPGHIMQIPEADAITADLPEVANPKPITLNADGPSAIDDGALHRARIDDELDLSDTERLFAELRGQQEVPLAATAGMPASSDWVNSPATDEPLDLDMTLEPASEPTRTAATPIGRDDDVEDADIISVEGPADSTVIDAADDTAGYATPASSASTTDAEEIIDEPDLPRALAKARQAESQLQEQLAALHSSMNLLHQQYDTVSVSEGTERLVQMQSLVDSESLAQAESQAREAAEALVSTQRQLLIKALQQRRVAQSKLVQAEAMQARHEAAAERCKQVAKQAAQLARQAAVAQATLKATALREQQARRKSEQSAQRAVGIARNAIEALQSRRAGTGMQHR